MQHRQDVVEQVLDAEAEPVEVALGGGRQVGAALLAVGVEARLRDLEPSREEVDTPVSELPVAKMMYHRTVGKIVVDLTFVGTKPQITVHHVRPVVRTWAVEQLAIRLPIYPSCIEWPVAVSDEAILQWPAALEQGVTHFAGVVNPPRFHHGRVTPRDFFMAQVKVEVVRDPLLETFKVNVNQERIAASLDPGE